jgi:hypothetical protein
MLLAFPKKKDSDPEKSPTMKAEVPEFELQQFANDMIEALGFQNIRFSEELQGWMKKHAPKEVRDEFFRECAGKWPDNTVLADLGGGHYFALKMELKTQDKEGRKVGELHGKQKDYADGWKILRSKGDIEKELNYVKWVQETGKGMR